MIELDLIPLLIIGYLLWRGMRHYCRHAQQERVDALEARLNRLEGLFAEVQHPRAGRVLEPAARVCAGKFSLLC